MQEGGTLFRLGHPFRSYLLDSEAGVVTAPLLVCLSLVCPSQTALGL